VAGLDYPRDRVDAIVVGDGGEAVVDAARARLDVAWIPQAPRGPSPARNEGAWSSRSELIAFVDDDCRPAPDWLRRLVARLEREPEAAVGGRVVNALSENPYASASQLIVDVGYRQNGAEPNARCFFCSNNLLARREQLLQIGGFDETFRTAEDRDLADRWMARGWRMAYVPEAIVFHAHRMGLRGFVRQHFEYGRGAHRLWSKRASSGRSGVIEPRFHLAVASTPLGRRRGRAELALLIGLWVVANAAGYAYQAAGRWIASARAR
jgi:GT2 family glycosyltransferase